MTAICIAGMHRSGTSLVARVLVECGVYLGPEEDLLPAAPENREGFWEHAGLTGLNDEILATLGGSWDEPPPFPDGWEERLAPLEERARELIAPLREHEPWGWKDPRNSLTLPFWRRVIGDDLAVVACLRDPGATAASLVERNGMTPEHARELCRTYAEALADAPVTVHYESLLADPETGVRRLAAALSLSPTGLQLARAVESVNPELQHHGEPGAGRTGASAVDAETRLEAARSLLQDTRLRLYAVQDKLAEADDRIEELHESARETDRRHRAEIAAFEAELAKCAAHVDELAVHVGDLARELEWMRSTRVWKIGTSYWNLRNRLLRRS